MSLRLELRDIEVDCVIGDLPEERGRPQRLLVSVALALDDAATQTDAIEDTVDYVELAAAIRQTLMTAECRLIERASRLVAETALRDPRVAHAQARVVKTGTVPGVAAAVAVYEMERHA